MYRGYYLPGKSTIFFQIRDKEIYIFVKGKSSLVSDPLSNTKNRQSDLNCPSFPVVNKKNYRFNPYLCPLKFRC